MAAKVAEAGLTDVIEVDSAGTGGWHRGEPADERAGGRGAPPGRRRSPAGPARCTPATSPTSTCWWPWTGPTRPTCSSWPRPPTARAKVRLLRSSSPPAAATSAGGDRRRERSTCPTPTTAGAARLRRRVRPHRRRLRRPAGPRPAPTRPLGRRRRDRPGHRRRHRRGARRGASAPPDRSAAARAATPGGSSSTTPPSCSPRRTPTADPELFACEADGLGRLGGHRPPCGCPVCWRWGPRGRIASSCSNGSSRAAPTPDHDDELGGELADLHRTTAPRFGLDRDTITGRRRQPNAWCDTWAELYGEYRLRPTLRLAVDAERLTAPTVARVERVIDRLPELVGPARAAGADPRRPVGRQRPGRLRRAAWLIDPAVSYSHREMDLAMMRLFGGFGPGVFAAYEARYPLADGLAGPGRALPAVPAAGAHAAPVAGRLRRRGRRDRPPLRLICSPFWRPWCRQWRSGGTPERRAGCRGF